MDDIIVLILTLIFIVAGIFGQMKKRQAVPAPESENRGAEDNFWELLDEELDKVRPPETIIPPKNEEVKNQEIN